MTTKFTFHGFFDTDKWSQEFNVAMEQYTIPENMHMVYVETPITGSMQRCDGIDIALKLLQSFPDINITMFHIMQIEMIRRKKPEVDILLAKQNVRFAEYPITPEIVSKLWSEPLENKSQNSIDITLKFSSQKISRLLHILHGADPKNPTTVSEKEDVKTMIKSTKDEFPSLINSSDEEIIDFLLTASSQREEVRKGEYLPGVFCDIEGTILQNNILNTKVFNSLLEFQSSGKEITLWTDGDVEFLSQKISTLGVNFPVESKSDFAGAIAEIIIDDLDEFAFTARTKITAQKFIKI